MHRYRVVFQTAVGIYVFVAFALGCWLAWTPGCDAGAHATVAEIVGFSAGWPVYFAQTILRVLASRTAIA